ncbi:MAG: 3-hydroxybutyryl-CoA dehydrogenase [Thermodesulfobacteriota bacterium]|nr:3-hydroxybutyryl-CoA dehydrogenase [Thermodesulfobacteriota bacterium]
MKKVGVLGCGIMGLGIAQVSAEAGYETWVRDIGQEFIDKGFAQIEKLLQRVVDKEKITTDRKQEVMNKLHGTLELKDLAGCDIIVEAAPEILDLKKQMFKELDKICEAHTIIASNTSSFSITEMGAVTDRPDRMVGMHFFNPVQVMKLVEVIKSLVTSEETINTAVDFSRSIGKEPVVAKDTSGFIVNLLLSPYIVEAIRTLENGIAGVEDIDKAMRLGCGYPMGPFTLLDMGGLDTMYYALTSIYESCGDMRYFPPPLLKRMVKAGFLGRKAGKGFYDYSYDPPQVNVTI